MDVLAGNAFNTSDAFSWSLVGVLISVEAVACTWFFSAAAAAWAAGRRRWLIAPLALLPVLPVAALTYLVISARECVLVPIAVPIILTTAAVVGAVIIIVRTRTSRGWLASRAGIMGVVVFVLLVLTIHQATEASAFERSQISSRAVATTVALSPGMPAPEDNAAIDLRALAPQLEEDSIREIMRRNNVRAWSLKGGNPPPDVEEVIRLLSPLFPVVESAAARPMLVAPRDFFKTLITLPDPEIHLAEQAAHVLAIRSRARFDAGERVGAWQDIDRQFRIANQLAQDLCLGEQRAQQQITAEAFAQVRRFAAGGGALAVHLQRMFPWQQRFSFGLAHLDAVWLQMITEYMDGPFANDLPAIPTSTLGAPLLKDLYRIIVAPREMAEYRTYFNGMRTSAAEGLYTTVVAYQSESRPRGNWFRTISLIQPSCREYVTADAIHAIITAAIKAQDIRARTGSWPVAADPSWPLDPFTNKPLLVAIEGDRLRIWSSGSRPILDRSMDSDGTVKTGDIALVIGPP